MTTPDPHRPPAEADADADVTDVTDVTDADLRAALEAERTRLLAAVERAQQDRDAESLAAVVSLLRQHLAAHEVVEELSGTSAGGVPRGGTEDVTIRQQLGQLAGGELGDSNTLMQLGLLGESLERHLAAQIDDQLPALIEHLDDDGRRRVLTALSPGAA